jgi:type II secretory pathway pseudopilin PulG
MPGISCRRNLSAPRSARDEMPSISCRRNLSAPRSARDEAGFALVEVIVSAVLLIILALSTLSVIDRAQATSSNNRSRDVAAQLAQSEQDVIRQMPIGALAGGYHTDDVPKKVGEITYLVSSSADWVTDSGGAVTCSTSGRVAYLKSTSTVTWPGMGSIKPVTADAIVDPGVAALGANKGALTVLLSKADGTGTPGIGVTAGGVSAVTDDSGCAVLANLDAGPQTLTYSAPGYVDKDSNPAPTKPVTIGAGTIAQASGSYDVAATINTTIVDDSTPTPKVATWNSVALDHAQRSTPTLFATLTGGSANASTTVFPFSSSYKAFVGDCTGNDPSNTLYTNAGAAPGAQVNPGQTKSVTLTMRNMTLDLGTAADVTGATIMIAPETAASAMAPVLPQAPCGGSTTYTGLTSATGKVAIPVPYGVWRVCAYKKTVSPTKYYFIRTSTTWNTASANHAIVSTTPTTTGTYAPQLLTKLTIPSLSTGSTQPTC